MIETARQGARVEERRFSAASDKKKGTTLLPQARAKQGAIKISSFISGVHQR
jgi:hypothetical protein